MDKRNVYQLAAVSVLLAIAIEVGCGPTTPSSPSPTNTPTPFAGTPTNTRTNTATQTPPNTATVTATRTPTGTPTVTSTHTATGTPTPTPAATVGQSSNNYVNGSVTITAGQSVKWTTANNGHPLNIDDSSGSCIVSNRTSFPYTQFFAVPGTYHFHCGLHSSCGNALCPQPATCTGMIGHVTVN
jgi:plastocyanin